MRIVNPLKKNNFLVRNYSIPEHDRFMGFAAGEINFGEKSYQQLCKRAVNGWDFNLASRLFKKIFQQVEL